MKNYITLEVKDSAMEFSSSSKDKDEMIAWLERGLRDLKNSKMAATFNPEKAISAA